MYSTIIGDWITEEEENQNIHVINRKLGYRFFKISDFDYYNV